MSAEDREAALAAVTALKADMKTLASTSLAVLTHAERLEVLDDLETVARQLPAVGHGLVNQLAAEHPKALGAGRWLMCWPPDCASARKRPERASRMPSSSGPVGR